MSRCGRKGAPKKRGVARLGKVLSDYYQWAEQLTHTQLAAVTEYFMNGGSQMQTIYFTL